MKTSIIVLAFLFVCTGITSCSKDAAMSDKGPSGKVQLPSSPIAFDESECEGGDDEDPEPMIYGTVQDTTDNDPIVGVCVALMSGTEVIAQTGTDESGHYYFNTVSNGQYAIRFIAEGYIVKFEPASIVNQTPDEVSTKLRPQ